MKTDIEAFDAAKDAIRALETDIVAEITRSECGQSVAEQANIEGQPRISAIILVDARFTSQGGVGFKAYLELSDVANHLFEAEVQGLFEKLGDSTGAWKNTALDVIDATPVPTGG